MTATVRALDRRRLREGAGRLGIVAPNRALAHALRDRRDVQWYVTGEPVADSLPVETLVYVPRLRRAPDLRPDLAHARAALVACRRAGTERVVLISSTAAYGASPRHPGLATERRPAAAVGHGLARQWLALEAAALEVFGMERVTVLRAAPVPLPQERDFFSRLLTARCVFTVLGHDPTLQLLSVDDLARAVDLALGVRRPGIFNIVPAAPIPLHAALRAAGRRSLPVPWTVHRAVRALLAPFGVASAEQAQYARYHLTASSDAAERELRFVPRDTSLDAVRLAVPHAQPGAPVRVSRQPAFDPFGLDRAYIERAGRGFMGFLHRRYWRVEQRGLEHIPEHGGGVLVGMHRGFMPFDGVMTLLTVVQGTGRVPRFLIHPGVGLRFPFLFNLMSKLGGVIASQENGDRVLASGELLGVYPEGIRGAFTMYRRAHRIGPSWRNDCVAFAIRHGVPIVPFVTIGSAEIFPILGRVDWGWWKKYSEWPFIPITPTFPLLPVPLPSKWHTQFLEPLHVEHDYPPSAADDPVVVRAVGVEVRRRMEAAVADLTSRRRSIFVGSLFPPGPA